MCYTNKLALPCLALVDTRSDLYLILRFLCVPLEEARTTLWEPLYYRIWCLWGWTCSGSLGQVSDFTISSLVLFTQLHQIMCINTHTGWFDSRVGIWTALYHYVKENTKHDSLPSSMLLEIWSILSSVVSIFDTGAQKQSYGFYEMYEI